MTKGRYQFKSLNYFSSVRHEILPLLPEYSKRVLEIGCGTGATLAWLKQMGRCEETIGIELMSDSLKATQLPIDQIISANIEEDVIDLPQHSFDLILCLDILEHLNDPWQILQFLVNQWLKPGGTVVVSLPNLRYSSVLINLLIRGRFEYENVGILDRTHLRFFTIHSAISLLQSAGLKDIEVQFHPSEVKGKKSIVNFFTLGFFRDTFSWQILLKGSKL